MNKKQIEEIQKILDMYSENTEIKTLTDGINISCSAKSIISEPAILNLIKFAKKNDLNFYVHCDGLRIH